MKQEEALKNYYAYLEETPKFKDIFKSIEIASEAGKFYVRLPYEISIDAGEKQYFLDRGFHLLMYSLQGYGWVISWIGVPITTGQVNEVVANKCSTN